MVSGGGIGNLGIHFLPISAPRNSIGQELEWSSRQPMSCENHSPSYSRKKVVSETLGSGTLGWASSLWQYFHRDVLRLHLLLELQGTFSKVICSVMLGC